MDFNTYPKVPLIWLQAEQRTEVPNYRSHAGLETSNTVLAQPLLLHHLHDAHARHPRLPPLEFHLRMFAFVFCECLALACVVFSMTSEMLVVLRHSRGLLIRKDRSSKPQYTKNVAVRTGRLLIDVGID